MAISSFFLKLLFISKRKVCQEDGCLWSIFPSRLFLRPAMSGCTARWLLLLNEFDITIVTPRELRSQPLLDLLAQFYSRECKFLHENLPCKEICSVKTREWRIGFNGSSTYRGSGAGVVLYDSDDISASLSFKLEFSCSNNEAEHDDLVLGVVLAYIGIQKLRARGYQNISFSKSMENLP